MEVTDSGGLNNFQGRYVILHPWQNALACDTPRRGQWGAPPQDAGVTAMTQSAPNTALTGAPPRAGVLPALLAQSLTVLDVTADHPLDPLGSAQPGSSGSATDAGVSAPASSSGCDCSAAGGTRPQQGRTGLLLAAAWLVCSLRRRSRRTPS
jgi:hypothetical protein